MKLLFIICLPLVVSYKLKAEYSSKDTTTPLQLEVRLVEFIKKRSTLSDSDSKRLGLFILERNKAFMGCRKDSTQDILACRLMILKMENKMRETLGEDVFKVYSKILNPPRRRPELSAKRPDSTSRKNRSTYQR